MTLGLEPSTASLFFSSSYSLLYYLPLPSTRPAFHLEIWEQSVLADSHGPVQHRTPVGLSNR